MKDTPTPKEFVFLRLLNKQIRYIDELINVCDPNTFSTIKSTVSVIGDWKKRSNITQNSVDKLINRVEDSLDRWKKKCPLDVLNV